MNETEELKPCPFCGGEAHYDVAVERQGGYATYYVFCRYCGAETAMFSSIPDAVAAWNKRAVEGDLRSRLKDALDIADDFKRTLTAILDAAAFSASMAKGGQK